MNYSTEKNEAKKNNVTKKHFILVGFGDAGTKIFPALMQICRDHPESLHISIVDVKSLDEISKGLEKKLKGRFKQYSNLKYEKKYLDFLKNNYFEDKSPSLELIPEDLITRIGQEPTIVYLAIDPDLYLGALRKYLHFGDIFAIEKPLAKNSKEAEKLVEFTREKNDNLDKLFIPVDHYRGKKQVLDLVERIIIYKDQVKNANVIVFSFLEERPPSTNTYFRSTGIIADMMPHVLALLKKILDSKFQVDIRQVKRKFDKKYVKKCEKSNLQYKETAAEMELFLNEEGGFTRSIIIRIGKGEEKEDRTVAFVDTGTDNILKIKLKPLKDPGIYIKSGGKENKLEDLKSMSTKWDNSWYNIIQELICDDYAQFLKIKDAQEIVEIIEKIKEKQ